VWRGTTDHVENCRRYRQPSGYVRYISVPVGTELVSMTETETVGDYSPAGIHDGFRDGHNDTRRIVRVVKTVWRVEDLHAAGIDL
jgi:hypothetical protein